VVEFASLAVSGYDDLPVPNTFIRQSETAHLAVILPGFRYTADMPSLHFAAQILVEKGADVLRVDYAYSHTDFLTRSEAEQGRWLSTDVQAACQVVLAQRSYQQFTLVGKSLGTLAIGYLLGDLRFHGAKCLWQTPLLGVEWLRTRITQSKPPSLFVIGTADPSYLPAYLAELETATQGRSIVLDDVDHSLEVPGSVAHSLDVLTRIVAEMQKFL